MEKLQKDLVLYKYMQSALGQETAGCRLHGFPDQSEKAPASVPAAVLAEQLAVGYVAVLATDSAAVLAWQHNLADSFAAADVLAEQLAVGYVAVLATDSAAALAWQHNLADGFAAADVLAEQLAVGYVAVLATDSAAALA